MKKVLATVAALGLIVTFSANALALDKPGSEAVSEPDTRPRVPAPTAPGVALWSVSGSWTLAGAYLSEGLGAPGKAAIQEDSDSNDAFYLYSFKVLPVLQVNDKIAMKGELRFADRDVFGLTDTKKLGVPDETGGRVMDVYHLYMEWTSPWGKTRFGRTPAGAWGSKFLDNSTQGNRLMWWLNMLPENWGALIFTQKITEQDAGGGPDISDQDRDAYYVDLSYKAPFGKTTGALWFVRDATNGIEPYLSTNLWLHGNYAFDALSLEYEVNWGFGEANANDDQKQLGLYADLGYKVQDWKLGGLFIYATGDDDPTDGDVESMMPNSTGLGKDFNPFQILAGDYMNILNGDNPLAGDSIHDAIKIGSGNAGVWALGGYANFAMSPAVSLNGYVGYAAATDEPTGFDDDYGFEAGLGFGYKIMDNLSYSAHFSYLWTGDYFTEAGTEDTQDIYLVSHTLSMSF